MQSPDNLIGKTIGGFTVRERIGQGGMATVYRAFQSSMNREVALKVIQLEPTPEGDAFRKRFAQEAEVVASLEHIHILPVFSYGIDGDYAYLAMRLLRGGTLSDLLEEGPFSIDQTGHLFAQFTNALAYAHRKGVIHRDIKPGNILLDDSGHAHLSDFGLAKLMTGTADLTASGQIVGTPAFISPEQLRGETLDHRADIYCLGCLLYYMLTGTPPFSHDTDAVVTIIYRHLDTPPEPPSSRNPEIKPALDAVVLRAMEKIPDDRFQSVETMAEGLRQAIQMQASTEIALPIGQETIKAAARARYFGSQWFSYKRNRMLGLATLLVAVVLAVFLGIITLTGQSDLPIASVLPGVVGTSEDATPGEDEIEAARERLGENGFIAYLPCTMATEYHSTLAREMSDFAEAYGLAFQIYDSDTDDYRQLTLIERARSDGATGLIVCPLSDALLSEALTSVQQAAIPLVLMSDPENKYGGVALAARDSDWRMGLKTGRWAGQTIRDTMDGQAEVIILDFPDMATIVERANGLESGILEYAPEANIIGRYLGGTRENAYDSVSRLLDDGVRFDVIASINDAGSFGAIQALEEAEIGPDAVMIASIDAEFQAQQYIRDDYYIRATLSLDRQATARDTVNVMVRLLGGGEVPEIILQQLGDMVTKETLQQPTPVPGG